MPELLSFEEFIEVYDGICLSGDHRFAGFGNWRRGCRHQEKIPFANKQQEELGLKVATKASSDLEFARRLDALFLPPPPPKPSGEPVRLLGLLQREARLIDFLMEPIGAYTDDQIGASVRDIHAKAGAVIRKHLTLDPVLPQTEGDKVTVPSGFDPSAIRLVGNVGGKPPSPAHCSTPAGR